MLNLPGILVSRPLLRLVLCVAVSGALLACGQKGNLVLPTAPAAAGRATLPDTVFPAATPAAPPASAAR